MQDILNIFFSDLNVLTPKTILEFFAMCLSFEIVGAIIDYIRGVK